MDFIPSLPSYEKKNMQKECPAQDKGCIALEYFGLHMCSPWSLNVLGLADTILEP